MEERKFCISCGMPLRRAEDYPGGDMAKDYCCHCAREDGTMKSFEEAMTGMTGFMIKTQGMTEEAAKEAAFQALTKNPAWKDRSM